ncbi:hypothetical protein N9095_00010 [bacterium]|nr:hypothetical protein [bacterium]
MVYTMYAGLKYYAMTGEGLIRGEDAAKYDIDHIIDVRNYFFRLLWAPVSAIQSFSIYQRKLLINTKMGKHT